MQIRTLSFAQPWGTMLKHEVCTYACRERADVMMSVAVTFAQFEDGSLPDEPRGRRSRYTYVYFSIVYWLLFTYILVNKTSFRN